MAFWGISNYADLRGVGGLRAPGRWHYAGQPIVYLAGHPALALLEILVHLETADIGQLPDRYQLLRVEVADDVPVAEIADADLPANPGSEPARWEATRIAAARATLSASVQVNCQRIVDLIG